jgi:hypothetical protein
MKSRENKNKDLREATIFWGFLKTCSAAFYCSFANLAASLLSHKPAVQLVLGGKKERERTLQTSPCTGTDRELQRDVVYLG